MSLPYPVPEPMTLHVEDDEPPSDEDEQSPAVWLNEMRTVPYRFFIMKLTREDVLIASVNTGLWYTTMRIATILDDAIKSLNGRGTLMLFFSVIQSGGFCGVAELNSLCQEIPANECPSSNYRFRFLINWLIIRDIPNYPFRNISITTNYFHSVCNVSNCTEVESSVGSRLYSIYANYPHRSSMLQRARGIVNLK